MGVSVTCEICNDRGVIVNDNGEVKSCICVIKKQLQIFLQPIIEAETRKDLDFSSLSKIVSMKVTDGDVTDFKSLCKSFMVYAFLNKEKEADVAYSFCSAYEIIEMYLSGEQEFQHLYYTPILFLDLTSYYSNKAMGKFISNILQVRRSKKLRTWVFTGHLKTTELNKEFGEELITETSLYEQKSLKKFINRK